MQNARVYFTLAAMTLLLSGLSTKQADAAVTATNFVLTSRSIKFDLNGKIPNFVPQLQANKIYFIFSVDRYYSLHPRLFDPSVSYPGTVMSQSVSGHGPALTHSALVPGTSSTVEYFFLRFAEPLHPNDILDLTIEVSWNNDVINTENFFEGPDIVWGKNPLPYEAIGSYYDYDHLISGTPLGIPEPSTVALLGGGAAAALVLAVRRRKHSNA